MNDNRFSHERIANLRSNAFASIKKHTAAIDDIAIACERIDCAMQNAIDEHNVDNQQSLINAARRLAALLETGVCE